MSISAGADHACAIKEDGTADCWLLYPKPTRPPEAIAATVSDRRPPVKWLRDDSPDCSNRNADQPSSRQGRITGLWLEDEWIDIGFLPKCGKLIPMASITTERLPVLGSSLKTWWRSGIVSVGGEPWGWIGVRLLPDGTIEVSFQRLNGKRIYPQMRYMSPSEHGEDWWSSSRFDAGIAAPEQQ